MSEWEYCKKALIIDTKNIYCQVTHSKIRKKCDMKTDEEIEFINRKHLIKTGMQYQVSYGLSSKLLGESNGIFTIEVVTGKKWEKDMNTTAKELAYLWKDNHDELKNALGCKIYVIDVKSFPYKQAVIHKGIKPGYDAKKGIIFRKDYLN